MFTLEALTQARRSTYTYEDIEFYAKQAAEGHYEGIPDDFDEFIKDKAPTNREELILWLYVCLTRNGLTGYFSRNANPKQPLNKSHIDFLYDAFFEEVQDCIVLGNRKGGKTLVFAALLLLEALFKPGIELAHLGAIKDQATRCYRYFLKMLKHSLFAGMLAKPPTATRTELINGSVVEILVGTITGVNCLHGDSLIECARDVEKYPNGIPIKDLVDKEVVVPTIHEKTGEVQYRKAKGIHSGKSKCVKVTVKSKDVTGKDKLDEVICTPEHPFLMLESHKYKKAYSLRPGDRLVPFDPPYVRDVEDIDTRFTKERRILLPQSWEKSDVTFRAEHREIAKAIFGRDVVNADVVVHHKDGRRLNNDPANLEVLDAYGIKRLGLRHVIEGREAEKKHLNKKWLVDQLRQGRTVTEIAREIGCSQSTVSLQMKKFGFTAKQLKDNPEAYYENHVVVSVEWLEGEHDVYDLSVIEESGDNGYRHNFSTATLHLANSPHPHKSQLDEVELMDWAVLQEALNMASSSGGYTGATRLTSTRKYSTGTMQQILDEADAKGFKVYQWNIWDTVEPCQIPKGVESFKVLKEEADETQAIYYVSKECLSCDLVNVCVGKARYSQGGIIPLKDALRNFKNLDKETWDAQVECLKPGTSDLLFPMFNPNVHVINYETVLKRRGLWESASSNYTSFGVCYNPNAEVLAGQDAGYGCPATVFGQMLDDETVVIFDEVYEHNLAPSILINEFLLPRDSEYYVQQWCCDPSGMQLIAEMEIQGLLAMQANNSIATGLDLIRSLLATKRLYITDNCVNLIQELKTYKKTRMGKVAPNQEDHAADAMRYLLMEMGLFTGIVDEVVMGAGS